MARLVTIGGVEYRYAYDYGAIIAFERIAGKIKVEQSETMLANAALHYSCLVGDENFTMSFAEFVSKISDKATLDGLAETLRVEMARWSGEQSVPAAGGSDEPVEVKPAKAKKK